MPEARPPSPPAPRSPPAPQNRPAPGSSPPRRAPPSPSALRAWRRRRPAPPRLSALPLPARSSPSWASAFASVSPAPAPRRCLRRPCCPRRTQGPFGPKPAEAFAWAARAWVGRGRWFPRPPLRAARTLSRARQRSQARRSWPRLQAAPPWRARRPSQARQAPEEPWPPLRVRADRAAAIPRRRKGQASQQSQGVTILSCPRGPVEVSLSSGHRVVDVVSRVGLRRRGS